jgi:hypothetical protein
VQRNCEAILESFGGDGDNGESLKFVYTHDCDDFGFGSS